jgi:hypothetical protein
MVGNHSFYHQNLRQQLRTSVVSVLTEYHLTKQIHYVLLLFPAILSSTSLELTDEAALCLGQ